MCFTLYIASNASIPNILFNKERRSLHTHPLTDYDSAIAAVFNESNVKYLGSSQQCGCGFRHLSYQNDGWPEEYLISINPEFGAESSDEHEALHEFLLCKFGTCDRIELYGCWDGDFNLPPARHETINVDDIPRSDFFFRDRCHYNVTIRSNPKNAG